MTRVSKSWYLVAFLSLAVAAYASMYVVLGDRMYPPPLAESFRARPWGIYPHAFFGAVALALGPFQFRRRTLVKRPKVHRAMGRVYLGAAAVAGVAGLYMSFYSYGGFWACLGFGTLAIALLTCVAQAWMTIRRGDIPRHREWVTRSFALLFAAVTLRIMIPLSMAVVGAVEPAYAAISWTCWVPNLLFAEYHLRSVRHLDPITLRPARAV